MSVRIAFNLAQVNNFTAGLYANKDNKLISLFTPSNNKPTKQASDSKNVLFSFLFL
jgi:hypothetical protein